MAKPVLFKLSESTFGCSQCNFRIELLKPKSLTAAQWAQRRRQQFLEHVKQQHTREDVNQAAARVVREATER
jgi:hypothetical protein